MRPLRYAINVTLDGCCDHEVMVPNEETDRYWAAGLREPLDLRLLGRKEFESGAVALRYERVGGLRMVE